MGDLELESLTWIKEILSGDKMGIKRDTHMHTCVNISKDSALACKHLC